MPSSCMCHGSLAGRMCNNQKYFCSPDKQDIRSLGHLNSELSDTMGYCTVANSQSQLAEVYAWRTISGVSQVEPKCGENE